MTGRIILLCALCITSVGAVQATLSPRDIDAAIVLGQSSLERERSRFHQPYRLTVALTPIDYVDVITPFRRVVLIAEQLARAGNRSFGQRQALERADVGAPDLELRVELTFHPLNTYVAVPAYEVSLSGAGAPRIEPRTFDRTPRYGPRVEGLPGVIAGTPAGPTLPGASQPILGGTVSATFDLQRLNPNGLYDVVITEGTNEVGRVKLDLSRMR